MEVALFPNRAKAQPLQERLVQAGIAAEVHAELRQEWLWFVSRRAAGARVEVPADQFDRAQELLAHWDAADGALRDAIRCPECKSLRVEYPQVTKKSLLTNLTLGLAAELGLVEKDYYCESCHFTWPRKGTRPRRDRPHMAPYYFLEGVEQTSLKP